MAGNWWDSETRHNFKAGTDTKGTMLFDHGNWNCAKIEMELVRLLTLDPLNRYDSYKVATKKQTKRQLNAKTLVTSNYTQNQARRDTMTN